MKIIKVLRIKKDMTQLEMAKALGITENKLCRIETGRSSPSYELIKKIAAFLGVTPSEILGNNEEAGNAQG